MTYCTQRGSLSGDHCCYVNGEVCSLLERLDGQFSCRVRREAGSWDEAVKTDEYAAVGQAWVALGLPFAYCQSWQPVAGQCCRE